MQRQEKQGQKTNFQAHQREARKNSQRLTLAFMLGIFLSAFSYFAVTWLLVTRTKLGMIFSLWLSSNNPDGTVNIASGAVVFSSLIALISIGVILWGFFQKKSEFQKDDADAIAASLGAQRLPQKLTLRQRQYVNVVEEMAVASGLAPPIILYTPNDHSINAFVTGGNDESVAITVSQGALDYLNREELQALVAHEFGHIFNRDVFLNNRLSAVLHGFFVIKELMTDDDDNDSYDDGGASKKGWSSWSQSSAAGFLFNSRFGIWGVGVMLISSGTIFFGKLLQATFSRQREWLADAHAVQYTRNKDALVGVFGKSMALQYMNVSTPPVADGSAHFLFINYQNKWLSTHPPLDARLARYGQKLYLDDLQALSYKMKQKRLDQEQAERKAQQKTRQASSSMMTGSGALLSLAGEGNETNDTNASQQNFITEKFIPLLILREYQKSLTQNPVSSPDEAASAVLAQFASLSNVPIEKIAQAFKWSDEQLSAVQQKIETLSEKHPSTHIQTFLHQLPMLRRYGEKQTLVKQVNSIIKADKSFDLCEMSYLLCLRCGLQKNPEESKRQRDFKQYEEDIECLLNVVAFISHEDDKGRASNFELMRADAMPMLQSRFNIHSIDDDMVRALYKSIQNLTYTKSIFRKSLLGAIEKNMLLDAQLSTEQNHLLFALKRFWA